MAVGSKKNLVSLRAWQKSPLKAVHSFSDGQYNCAHIDVSSSPVYDEKKWSKGDLLEKHNCYNYSLNLTFNQHSKLQPGEIGFSNGHVKGKVLEDFYSLFRKSDKDKEFCETLLDLSKRDGLIWLDDKLETRPGYRLIALAMARQPGGVAGSRDFHWYRQDRDGTWSHKPGDNYARPLEVKSEFEDNMADIVYPHEERADRGKYKNFMGYFLVPENSVPCEYKNLKKANDFR